MLPTRSLTCQRGLGQVVLRWLTNATSSLSPSRRRLKRMVENLDVFDFTLTEGELSGEVVGSKRRIPLGALVARRRERAVALRAAADALADGDP